MWDLSLMTAERAMSGRRCRICQRVQKPKTSMTFMSICPRRCQSQSLPAALMRFLSSGIKIQRRPYRLRIPLTMQAIGILYWITKWQGRRFRQEWCSIPVKMRIFLCWWYSRLSGLKQRIFRRESIFLCWMSPVLCQGIPWTLQKHW